MWIQGSCVEVTYSGPGILSLYVQLRRSVETLLKKDSNSKREWKQASGTDLRAGLTQQG